MHDSRPSFMFPSVCRNIAKQTYLETLQDNLIEMDILPTSRHDGAYNDGYVTHPINCVPFCMNSPTQPTALTGHYWL